MEGGGGGGVRQSLKCSKSVIAKISVVSKMNGMNSEEACLVFLSPFLEGVSSRSKFFSGRVDHILKSSLIWRSQQELMEIDIALFRKRGRGIY